VIGHQHRGSAVVVAAAGRNRLPWVVLVAIFTLALVGFGLTPSASGAAQPAPAGVAVHSPIAMVGPAALPQVVATSLHAHTVALASSPLAATGTAIAIALLALAVARRATAGPAPIAAAARRMPPGRAPPGLSFTR
jgi:hypothetical protein